MDQMCKIINFDEDVEVSEGLDDGLYSFSYRNYTRGNHEADQRDPDNYPTVIAELELRNQKGETFNRKETFKMKDTPYNRTRLARFFLSMGCPKNPNGSVKMVWNTAVGKTGWVELSTKKIGQGNDATDWQGSTFILPEDLEKVKARIAAVHAQPQQIGAQPQPQPQPQPVQQPQPSTQPTWNSGMSW